MSSNSFNLLEINNSIISALAKQNILEPTEIQIKAIPLAKEGKDILAQSETGTGKTLAYLIPIIENIDLSIKTPQAIVLAPTHELVVQIKKELDTLIKDSDDEVLSQINSISLIGDVNIKRQIDKLKDKPQIIIGTTGRIVELLEMRKMKAHTVKTIVLDEGDRLLDETNIEAVERIIKATLKSRQLMLFSATMPEEIIALSNKIMKEPTIVKSSNNVTINENIEHLYFTCEKRDKILLIRKLMASIKPEKALLFINNCNDIETLTSKLQYHNLKVDYIHGTLVKNQRRDALDRLKSGKINLLVTSDLSCRGLHIEGITHVFNLDLPEDSKNYLHRVGRTGRAGNKGTAISIVTENEIGLLQKYCTLYDIEISPKEISHGKIFDLENIKSENKFYSKMKSKSPKKSNSKIKTTKKKSSKSNSKNKGKTSR